MNQSNFGIQAKLNLQKENYTPGSGKALERALARNQALKV